VIGPVGMKAHCIVIVIDNCDWLIDIIIGELTISYWCTQTDSDNWPSDPVTLTQLCEPITDSDIIEPLNDDFDIVDYWLDGCCCWYCCYCYYYYLLLLTVDCWRTLVKLLLWLLLITVIVIGVVGGCYWLVIIIEPSWNLIDSDIEWLDQLLLYYYYWFYYWMWY